MHFFVFLEMGEEGEQKSFGYDFNRQILPYLGRYLLELTLKFA